MVASVTGPVMAMRGEASYAAGKAALVGLARSLTVDYADQGVTANAVAPGKRPMHTIIPGLCMKGDRVAWSYGVMGGAYQPVGHTHVLTNMLDYGMDPQEALDCPRVFHMDGRLDVERGLPDSVAPASSTRATFT